LLNALQVVVMWPTTSHPMIVQLMESIQLVYLNYFSINFRFKNILK